MPTIAARYTLFLRILAPINSQSSAAHGLPNWSFLLYCMECFAKLQILMKQHAALGVLVLPARDGKMVPAETTGTGCTIIPRRTMVPQLLIPAGSPMALLPRKGVLAIAAVIDIALNARGRPVAAKALATRHRLPPRHLEPVLQALVRHGILKGIRGPRGGYELAREQRRITADDILRASSAAEDEVNGIAVSDSLLLSKVVMPALAQAENAFAGALARITVEDLAHSAESLRRSSG